MKAKLIKLTSGYGHGLVAGTGRLKMDIQFPDGALFCIEPEQVRILEE